MTPSNTDTRYAEKMSSSRIVSVVTPVYNPVPEHLKAAYQSLLDQQLPEGWEWEWVVQEDGRTGAARDILPDDPRIRFGIGRHSGAAIIRNLALAKARGSLIKNLDHDDMLVDGALARDIAVLAS